MRSHLSVCIVLFTGVAFAGAAMIFAPAVAIAQANDRISADLATARINYESTMESLRKDAGTIIQAEINKAGVDQDKLNDARRDREAFEGQGKLPNVTGATPITNRFAIAASKMTVAYGKALAAYTKAHDDTLTNDVNQDSKLFSAHWDLAPWSERLTEGGRANQPLTAAAPLSVALRLNPAPATPPREPVAAPTSVEYRFEIRGARTAKSGGINIQFPLANGQQLTVPAIVGARGEIHVFVSVFKDHVSADAGVGRPIDMSKAIDGPSDSITLTTDGSFAINSVRVKAVIDGPLPEVQKVVTSAGRAAPAAAATAADLFPVGSKWTGTIERQIGNWGERAMVATVHRLDGNQVFLQCSDSGYHYTFRIGVVGNTVTPMEISDGGADRYSNVQGTGTVTDGHVSFVASWNREGHGTGNGQKATITLIEQ